LNPMFGSDQELDSSPAFGILSQSEISDSFIGALVRRMPGASRSGSLVDRSAADRVCRPERLGRTLGPSWPWTEVPMTDQNRPDQPPAEDCSDLEYDLAHEAVDAATDAPSAIRRPAASTYVVTETDGYDGDYGYDLAHDIPKPQRGGDRPDR
jgi:hypothetical protein